MIYHNPLLQNIINDYMFYHISSEWARSITNPIYETTAKTSCCSMVEEMNRIKVMWFNDITASNLEKVLRECVCQRHGHQYCISKDAVDNATIVLAADSRLKDAILKSVIVFKDFEDLYDHINKLIGGITGIGPLTVYDTAKRIGHLLACPIYPYDYVYLCAGAKAGAEKLLGYKLNGKEPTSTFYPYFGSLPSIFIEDILCIYKKYFTYSIQKIKSLCTRELHEKVVKGVITMNKKNGI